MAVTDRAMQSYYKYVIIYPTPKEMRGNDGYERLSREELQRSQVFNHFSYLLFFTMHYRKKEPHIGVLAGFVGAPWDKLWGKKQPGSVGFTRHQLRCKSAVFWQTGR